MANSIATNSNENATGSHEWVMFSNPRNGRIQVSACKHCGIMHSPALAARTCQPEMSKNAMKAKGWIIVDTEVEPSSSNEIIAA